jgi:hypothetical protein
MPTIESSIWLALKSRINTLPLTYPKAWPGQTFEVPNDGTKMIPYLRIGRVTVAPVRQLVAPGKPQWRSGSLIVTLVYPLGQDISVYDDIGGQIAAHFADGTQMRYNNVCVSIVEYPHVQEGYEDNGFWTVPVIISWRCFA